MTDTYQRHMAATIAGDSRTDVRADPQVPSPAEYAAWDLAHNRAGDPYPDPPVPGDPREFTVLIDPPYESGDGRTGQHEIHCQGAGLVRRALADEIADLDRLTVGQVPLMVEVFRTK